VTKAPTHTPDPTATNRPHPTATSTPPPTAKTPVSLLPVTGAEPGDAGGAGAYLLLAMAALFFGAAATMIVRTRARERQR
jgi:hypothetical protein